MSEVTTRTLYKTVTVDVEVTVGDVLQSFSDATFKRECRARGIRLYEDHAPRHQTAQERKQELEYDMSHAVALYQRGQVEDALLAMERILPFEMRNFSVDIERHYRRTLCP